MKFEAMTPYVLPSLGGCTEDLAIRHLRLAARDFFARTGVWKETLPDVQTAADTTVYPMAVPDGAEFARLLEVSVDGEPVDELVTQQQGNAYLRDEEDCSAAWVIEQRDLGLYMPSPVADVAIVVEAVLRPTLTSTEVPDQYAEQHLEGIVHGALARLLALPRVPWQSAQDAANERAEFESAITAAAGMAGVGHIQGRLRTRPA